jgi:polar amino acid transport system substrate-binding protein
MKGGNMTEASTARRSLFRLGATGLGLAAAGAMLDPQRVAAQASSGSLLRTVVDRGHLIVGTGSTNPPWHFEDEKGKLTGMDIAMARILAKGLFDDETKVEYVRQEANARIPNITTGKVDAVIQFMTVSPARAQLVAFSRPYYVEGAALMTAPKAKWQTYKDLLAASKQVRASVLQNVDADKLVHNALPEAQVMQLDSQANVMQAVTAARADVAVVDASTVKWLMKHNPGEYTDPGYAYEAQLYSAAVRQGDPDWLHWIDTCFNVAMHGHQPEIYTAAFEEFFGEKPPVQKPGFPPF